MTTKIDRVQNYVKERQTGALNAEKKQQDAERMADRWQKEVLRLQDERDDLQQRMVELEGRQLGQAKEYQGAHDQHMNEVSTMNETLRKREEQMKQANEELLRKREGELQAKINLERQREKERSIALLKKKDQEVQIKDQQLRAARTRLQELEGSNVGAYGAQTAAPPTGSIGMAPLPPPLQSSPRGRRPLSGGPLAGGGAESGLPPLPLSAR